MKSLEYLGDYEVAVPPTLRGIAKIDYLTELGNEYAQDEGYAAACIFIRARGRNNTYKISIFIYED